MCVIVSIMIIVFSYVFYTIIYFLSISHVYTVYFDHIQHPILPLNSSKIHPLASLPLPNFVLKKKI